MRSSSWARVGVGSAFDGVPRDGGNCFEEAQDSVLALGVQPFAESSQDAWGEVYEIHHGVGEVGREFIGVRIVVQRLCDSPVPRADRRVNTQDDLEAQPLCVGVVRFDEVVIVHLAMMVMVLCRSSTTSSS